MTLEKKIEKIKAALRNVYAKPRNKSKDCRWEILFDIPVLIKGSDY